MQAKRKQRRRSFESYAGEIGKSITFLASYLARGSAIEFDDAKQEMMLAAWKAYRTYDPNIARFSTYAVRRMKNRLKTLARFGRERVALIEDSSLVVDLQRVTPEVEVVDAMSYAMEAEQAKVLLNEIENLLLTVKRATGRVSDEQAYVMFQKLRREYKQLEYIDRVRTMPKTLSDVARDMDLSISRAATIFSTKIRVLGTADKRASIVQQIGQTAGKVVEIEEPNRARRKEMAKAKAKVKGKKGDVKRGRTPQKGGLRDKIAWVSSTFCDKGKSRPEAVEGLLGKYPEMSKNYARTVVYSSMKEYDFAAAERKSKAPKAKKGAAKKVAPKAKKAARNTEDAEDVVEEF